MTRKQFHLLVALLLLVCLACPFVETAFHSNGNIFQTGQDGETSLAVLLLILELLFALSIPLILHFWNILVREGLVLAERMAVYPPKSPVDLLEFPPPLFLRI
jgi:hypothetical protein